jgi:hypothetical protein
MKESWEGPDRVLIDDVEKQRLDEASASEGASPERACAMPDAASLRLSELAPRTRAPLTVSQYTILILLIILIYLRLDKNT